MGFTYGFLCWVARAERKTRGARSEPAQAESQAGGILAAWHFEKVLSEKIVRNNY